MNSKQSKSVLNNKHISSSERESEEHEIEKIFSEIESFNKAIEHLKDSFYEKLKSDSTLQLNKEKSK